MLATEIATRDGDLGFFVITCVLQEDVAEAEEWVAEARRQGASLAYTPRRRHPRGPDDAPLRTSPGAPRRKTLVNRGTAEARRARMT